MELTDEQVKKFKKIHEPYGGLGNYTDKEIREIAQGVANYFITLHEIQKRHNKPPSK